MSVKSKVSRRTWRDPDDAPKITDKWIAEADRYRGKKLLRRGRPAGSGRKTQTTLRISKDIPEFFRSSGPGGRLAWIVRRAMAALEKIETAIEAYPRTGQARRLVKFLAGIYNGEDYPFDLTELRALDTELANACLDYLNYDLRPRES